MFARSTLLSMTEMLKQPRFCSEQGLISKLAITGGSQHYKLPTKRVPADQWSIY